VYVEGRLQTDEYTDKDGNNSKTTRVRRDRVVLRGGGGRGAGAGTGQMPPTEEQPVGAPGYQPPVSEPSEPLTEDDIPF